VVAAVVPVLEGAKGFCLVTPVFSFFSSHRPTMSGAGREMTRTPASALVVPFLGRLSAWQLQLQNSSLVLHPLSPAMSVHALVPLPHHLLLECLEILSLLVSFQSAEARCLVLGLGLLPA